jgi:glucokinase
MAKIVGVVVSDRMSAGLVVDHKLVGELRRFPEHEDDKYALVEMPTEGLVRTICEQVVLAADNTQGISVVEEAPNLPQLKGARIEALLEAQLRSHDLDVPVTVVNDADATAAGLASVHGRLDSTIRVWTLGWGIGYGRYPFMPGVWEGGHTVVTLDEKECYCGCGGRGHMEGIMGHRAMRLRFLDMEPEEVFEAAKAGDARCLEFKRMWHKALAAATSTSIHMAGPGRFFLTGFNIGFLDMAMLRDYMQQMVKMSSLQSYALEVVQDDPLLRVIGGAISAEQAAGR